MAAHRGSSELLLPLFNQPERGVVPLGTNKSEESHRQEEVDDDACTSFLSMATVFTAMGTAGLLLFSFAITMSMLFRLGPSHFLRVVSSPYTTAEESFCDSFILNAEVNNLQGWAVSDSCVPQVKKYMTDKYFVDFTGAIDAAADYLNGLDLKGNGSEIVVFDIDETSLSNLPYYTKHNYGAELYDPDLWNAWVDKAAALPLEPTVTFANQLKEINVKAIFLTGRPESQRNVTLANMAAVGYEGPLTLLLRSPSEEGLLAVKYKSQRRLQLEEAGFRVLCTIGDQWSDIQGPASGDRSFKLPNPMYYIF